MTDAKQLYSWWNTIKILIYLICNSQWSSWNKSVAAAECVLVNRDSGKWLCLCWIVWIVLLFLKKDKKEGKYQGPRCKTSYILTLCARIILGIFFSICEDKLIYATWISVPQTVGTTIRHLFPSQTKAVELCILIYNIFARLKEEKPTQIKAAATKNYNVLLQSMCKSPFLSANKRSWLIIWDELIITSSMYLL